MLNLLRKYQRILFIIVSVVIISTFVFVGNYDSYTNKEQSKKDGLAFVDINNSDVMQSEVEQTLDFLFSDAHDYQFFGEKSGANYLNDGVITKDFFRSGFAAQLASFYSAYLEKDYEKRVEKEKDFELYTHPLFPQINVESVWQRYQPDVYKDFLLLKKIQNPLTLENFQQRVNLYLCQKQFPADLTKQILYYQEAQSISEKDSDILQRDFSLFGYHSLKDWFGQDFLFLLIQTLFNGAALAEQKGYTVSDAEVKADLAYNQYCIDKKDQSADQINLENYLTQYQAYLKHIGWKESEAIKVWKKVLLFRKIFQDVGQNILLDSQMYRQFSAYAGETTEIDLYTLPEELRIHNYLHMQQLEIYLKSVCKTNKKDVANRQDLILPNSFYSAKELEKRFPELVQMRYLVKIKEMKKDALHTKIGLQQNMEWLIATQNRPLLLKQFPAIEAYKELDEESFALQIIEWKKWDQDFYNYLQKFANNQIVISNPQWIKEELEKIPAQEQELAFCLAGDSKQIKGLKNPKELMAILDHAFKTKKIEESASFSSAAIEYCPDDLHIYQIEVVEKASGPEILSFATAKKEGILLKILRKELQKEYEGIRQKYPEKFQSATGGWKPFDVVKEEVASLLFEPLLTQIKKDEKHFVLNKKELNSYVKNFSFAEDYAPYRLWQHILKIKKELDTGSEIALWEDPATQKVGETKTELHLANQWKLKKKSIHLKRSDTHPFLDSKKIANLPLEYCSSIHMDSQSAIKGNLYFYRVKARYEEQKDFEALFDKGQALLQAEISKEFFKTLLILQKEQTLAKSDSKKID